jgi:5-methylcytosine-specific restriction endonuclease McrA
MTGMTAKEIRDWMQRDAGANPTDHPGFPPEQPEYPKHNASFWLIRWIIYQIGRWRWRNHHKKRSPFWTFYRNKFLKSGFWRHIQNLVFARDGYRCTDKSFGKRCTNTIVDGPLHVHHTSYYSRGKPIIGHEDKHLRLLVTVCKPCHDRLHAPENKGRKFEFETGAGIVTVGKGPLMQRETWKRRAWNGFKAYWT